MVGMFEIVTREPVPRVHPLFVMDGRIKPGHDDEVTFLTQP
ncbi:hypothetical protein ACVJGD_007121 [Bradyrhizobium sp. USDA 10063]